LAIKKKKYHSCFINPCLKRRGKGKGILFVHKKEKKVEGRGGYGTGHSRKEGIKLESTGRMKETI
jgi:hypothetical protein